MSGQEAYRHKLAQYQEAKRLAETADTGTKTVKRQRLQERMTDLLKAEVGHG